MAICSSPCRERSPTGMISCPRRSPPEPPRPWCRRPVEGPHILVADVPKALTDLAIAARKRMYRHGDGRNRIGRQDLDQGGALCRAGAVREGQGPPLGQKLQQPYRRSAQPGPDAARQRICGARNGHEPRRRDRRADPAGPAPCRVDHHARLGPHRISRLAWKRSRTPRSEIFEGLEPEGVAIVPEDTPYRDRLVKAARKYADRTITFGHGEADVWRCTRSAPKMAAAWSRRGWSRAN